MTAGSETVVLIPCNILALLQWTGANTVVGMQYLLLSLYARRCLDMCVLYWQPA